MNASWVTPANASYLMVKPTGVACEEGRAVLETLFFAIIARVLLETEIGPRAFARLTAIALGTLAPSARAPIEINITNLLFIVLSSLVCDLSAWNSHLAIANSLRDGVSVPQVPVANNVLAIIRG